MKRKCSLLLCVTNSRVPFLCQIQITDAQHLTVYFIGQMLLCRKDCSILDFCCQ